MQVKINAYDSISTGRYQGKWQIKVGRIGKEDKFFQDFKIAKKKDGTEIKIPVSLTFDTDKEAMDFLKSCLAELENEQPVQDIPF